MTDKDNRRDNPKRGELPPHREDVRAPQQEAQEGAQPNPNTRDDGRGRDASRTGSDSNAD
jgi:hypothetical protein